MLKTALLAAIVALVPVGVRAQTTPAGPTTSKPAPRPAAAMAGDAMGTAPAMTDQAIITSAMSAAPAAVARTATIVKFGSNGAMTVLRKGSNGFTCMADNTATPGPDPMCCDANALAWARALMGHKPPAANKVGFIYMLEGGTDASNTDPFAQKPSANNNWVKTGPHVMVVGAMSMMQGYPASPKPNTKEPYVMWAGTPYAHLMIPVR